MSFHYLLDLDCISTLILYYHSNCFIMVTITTVTVIVITVTCLCCTIVLQTWRGIKDYGFPDLPSVSSMALKTEQPSIKCQFVKAVVLIGNRPTIK